MRVALRIRRPLAFRSGVLACQTETNIGIFNIMQILSPPNPPTGPAHSAGPPPKHASYPFCLLPKCRPQNPPAKFCQKTPKDGHMAPERRAKSSINLSKTSSQNRSPLDMAKDTSKGPFREGLICNPPTPVQSKHTFPFSDIPSQNVSKASQNTSPRAPFSSQNSCPEPILKTTTLNTGKEAVRIGKRDQNGL